MATESGSPFRALLRRRDFRLLIGAFLVDQIGSWAYNVVLIVYVYDRTGSPAWIAATTAAGWVPRILFSTYAGVLADRYERTRVLVVSALTSFAVMVALAVVIATDGPIPVTLLLAAVAAAVSTTYHPAAQALIPEVIVETELASANATLAGVENLVVVLGPAIGGLLLLTGEPTWGILVNATTFVLAALLILRVRARSRGSANEQDSLVAQIAGGVRALRATPLAVAVVAFCALDTAVYGASTVLYVPISERLGTGSNGYSYLLAGAALGGVLVAAMVNRLSAQSRLYPVIMAGMLLLALPIAAVSLTHSPVVGFLLQVLSGAGMVVVDVLAVTVLQRDVPGDVLSRVFGILQTVVLSAALVTSFLVAAALSVLSLTSVLLIVGVGFSVLALLGLPALRRADASAAANIRGLGQRVTVLNELELFASASRLTLELLAAACEDVELPAGSVIIREGDQADALWVIMSGEVEVTALAGGGTPRLLRSLSSGTYVGEIGLVHQMPRSATVTTTMPTSTWRIPASVFLAALHGAGISSTLLARSSARLAYSHPHLTPSPLAPVTTEESDTRAT